MNRNNCTCIFGSAIVACAWFSSKSEKNDSILCTGNTDASRVPGSSEQ